MEILKEFEDYLRLIGKSEKTISNYVGAFSFISKLISKNSIPEVHKWNSYTIDEYIKTIAEDNEFISKNTKGNNMYSASLNNFKKYMSSLKPIIPFPSFGWRWASTGIASHLNQPKSLKVILDALLINGNGQDNYTNEFKKLISKLCTNKYNISSEESDKLTKLSNSNVEKNIIENSANYWYHLGLLETTGRNAKVDKLGEDFLNGIISNDEFIRDRIEKYYLPNKAYKNVEVAKWEENGLKIFPLKLIQDIFKYLENNVNPENKHITESELSKIIIPCSSNLETFNIPLIAKHILEYRNSPEKYSDWPSPQDNYTDDKGYRMANEFLYFLEVFGFLKSESEGKVRTSDKQYAATEKLIELSSNNDSLNKSTPISSEQLDHFNISNFQQSTQSSGLTYSNQLISRYISSLATKPFVLLSGLSGSGKTKLAQSFAQWICEDEKQYKIVPVGADWTNREPLLGYVNALNTEEYILPENGALQLIIEANKEENQNKPYFLILDEMNLSHVERYFADFLSVMESKDKFKLHSDKESEKSGVPHELSWPKNLFIIGTVNIDETTYMFSPKVLDRANVIEFRVSENEISDFLAEPKEIDLSKLEKQGATMAEAFVTMTENKDFEDINTDDLNESLKLFFVQLQKSGAEFGYRTAMEIHRLFKQLSVINNSIESNEKIDIAIMQKLLPKLHGSRRKLCPILDILASFCVNDSKDVKKDFLDNKEAIDFHDTNKVKYPLSLEKITRMYNGAIENGFASYAEA